MQRGNKRTRIITYLVFLIFFFLNFGHKTYAQITDIDILRQVTSGRNLHYKNFNKSISFSVYPVTLAGPGSLLLGGIIKKDTSLLLSGICMAAAVVLNTGSTYCLKYGFNRSRPYIAYPDIIPLTIESTPSFPSGHSSTAFNIATSFSLLFPKWYVIVPSYLWAGSVAYSRLYLGVHYPSDILAGAIIGSGTAYLSYYVSKKYIKKFQKKRPEIIYK
ncbi:MAG: phosphatase PAP2 family protein [Bacteroidia bacterium]|nr:phosphatase PAP2 family protein [Bacteroidia bacterium]MCZ2248118.1 phosphatase PAP2 family protein [Bacteroidia bacterium]